MSRKFSWTLGAVFALVGAQILSAQSASMYPHAANYNASALGAAPRLAPSGDPPIHIIPLDSPLKFGGTNAPDTYSANSTFNSTPVLVDDGKVRIWQEQVATGSNGEWEIFHMQATSGLVAGNINANWNILMDYTLSAPVSFDAVAMQWLVNGAPSGPLSNFGTICCAATSNPILPGPAFYNSGFNGLLPAGVQTNWQQVFVNPYNFAASGGVNTSAANEFTFALHFTLVPPALPTITNAISAGAYGAFPTFGPGSWIEVFGTNFAVGSQTWDGSDFNGVTAPTKLGGISVTIAGQAAFVYYFNPTQINLQVPAGVSAGSQSIVVTTLAGASAPFTVTVDAIKPALLAPDSFKIGGTQYVVALFPDGTYVLPPDAIAGIASRRARPGDIITFYGIGFGSVTPAIPPGQIAQQSNTLAAPFTVSFGSATATVKYDGLAPNYVGLYQFNVVVPDVAASDAVPLTFSLNGAGGTQSLSIAVGN